MSDGSPQGSPLSPILSAIYTFPLLRLAESWNFCSLQLYVDDGSITVAGFARATPPQEGIVRETPKSTQPSPKAKLQPDSEDEEATT